MRKLLLSLGIVTLLVSCASDDVEVSGGQIGSGNEEVNSFDFSTVQSVNLTVDYSAFQVPTPVLFSVYSEDPFVGEEETMTLREDIKPLYEAYTDRDGKFNDVVKLPAYVKQLYVVTGNSFVTEYLMTTDVKDGAASLVAVNKAGQAAPRKALQPADVFQEQSKIEEKRFSTTGVYCFEDMWPAAGDYDFNDVMVEVRHERVYSVESGATDYKFFQETFYLTTAHNHVELQSGLGLTLDTKETPESIVMKKVDPNTKDTTEVAFQVEGNTYLLINSVKSEVGATYILELNYKEPGLTKISNTAEVKAFIYRSEVGGRWEVHVPYEAPTSRMVTSYFGTLADKSVPEEGMYFVRDGYYPFALYLEGASLDDFKETLLRFSNESVRIDDLYPAYRWWVDSNGTEYADWYLMRQ